MWMDYKRNEVNERNKDQNLFWAKFGIRKRKNKSNWNADNAKKQPFREGWGPAKLRLSKEVFKIFVTRMMVIF
jgi:hypothetical protein